MEVFIKRLLCLMVAFALVNTLEARPRRGDPAVGQAIGGLFQGLSTMQREAERQSRQEAERQRRLEAERQRQYEISRRRAEADAAKAEAQRLEMQRLQRLAEEQRMQRQLAEDRRRQLEMEKQKLALDRQRWAEEADHEGWFIMGVRIPSWLWQGCAVSLLMGVVSLVFKGRRR